MVSESNQYVVNSCFLKKRAQSFYPHPRILLLILERKEGTERKTAMSERNIDQLPLSWAPTRDQTYNLVVYGTTLQPTEPPGQEWWTPLYIVAFLPKMSMGGRFLHRDGGQGNSFLHSKQETRDWEMSKRGTREWEITMRWNLRRHKHFRRRVKWTSVQLEMLFYFKTHPD